MLRESGSGQDIFEVSGGILWNKRIQLRVRNTSSLVVDRLCDQPGDVPAEVACLYYDFLFQNEQSITDIMGAILKQLVGRGDIPKDIREAFQKGKKELGGRGLLHADLMRMLKMAIASLLHVFICIDALDECLPRNLLELLESIRDVVLGSPTTRIFLTGRPHVLGAIQRYFTGVVVIPISPNTDDVRNYLQMKLDRDEEPEAMDNDLRADIVKTILDKMSDMCVRGVALPLSMINTYGKLCVDSSLLR